MWPSIRGSKLTENQLTLFARLAGVTVIAMDELHTYIGAKKNVCWLWVAVDRDARQFPSTAYWVPAIPPRASNEGRGQKRCPLSRNE